MKILILSNSGGGLVHFRRQLIETIARNHEVVVCVPKSDFSEAIEMTGARLIHHAFSRRGTNPLADYNLYHYYRKLIINEKPDMVLTYTVKPNVYGGMACIKTGTPYIANITGLGTSIENGGFLSELTLWLYKKGLKRANCVFFQNCNNKSFFEEEGIVSGATRLIPGSGVDLEEHAFEEYPWENEGIRFLFVGRIMRNKGINELLAAFEEIHIAHPDISLDIVGGCDEHYEDVLKVAEGKGYIRYHGQQKSMHSFYTNTHCTVLPSYHEGMANVLLESSSTGRPVIASRVAGCEETFEEGVTGFGCEARSIVSLRGALERFLALTPGERAEMGRCARKKISREFDRKIVIDAYLEEIEIVKERLQG